MGTTRPARLVRAALATAVAAVGSFGLITACSSSDGKPPTPTTSSITVVRSALSDAAARGDLATVQSLLKAGGVTVDERDDQGRTALVAASYGGHIDVAKALIAAGADVNAKDRTSQSSYLIATSEIGEAKGLELLRLTLANGADVKSLDSYNGTGLIRAADRGFVDIVNELLTTDIDKDHVNRLGWTALLEAIILGGGDAKHTDVVRRLVAAGVDVNLADGQGVTPLTHATNRGYTAMIDLLRSAGAR
ncbi:MAG: ankyrin repeat domain-containing protein [Acidimicrobiia bacterium]